MPPSQVLEALRNVALANDEQGDVACRTLSAKRPLDLLNGLAWAEEPEVFLPATDALHKVMDSATDGVAGGMSFPANAPPPPIPDHPAADASSHGGDGGGTRNADVSRDEVRGGAGRAGPAVVCQTRNGYRGPSFNSTMSVAGGASYDM